ncbi:unnamed protein product [Cylicocyclus nassatus]|uniref:Eukaryotic translation initiation factor 3 30 kDa subunit n=1 Tax=Cylicocyclus nassatus TaxID=53992 RepID=A0AA36GFP0_CYLNA|nr:unnamed protein product [Cylicocyclus nassatus]
MGDNWDDDDFEPEVESLAPHPPPVEHAETPTPPSHATESKAKPKDKHAFPNMESFSRELTAAEREEMQRRQDLALTMEMFGEQPITGDQRPYSDILSKDEFEDWGLKVGTFLATRHKAAHYGDMLNKLIQTVAEKLDAHEVRIMSNHLKTIADSKKAAEKTKPAQPAPGQKKGPKPTLKVNKASNKQIYNDLDGDDFDDYEDFM